MPDIVHRDHPAADYETVVGARGQLIEPVLEKFLARRGEARPERTVEVHASNRARSRETLCPPKPSELLSR